MSYIGLNPSSFLSSFGEFNIFFEIFLTSEIVVFIDALSYSSWESGFVISSKHSVKSNCSKSSESLMSKSELSLSFASSSKILFFLL